MQPAKLFQPDYYNSFRCIGAACEDTCCTGWKIHVDRRTYEKYRDCGDAELRGEFENLITILGKGAGDDDFAIITLNGASCPFLCEGLCSIQTRAGEEFLPNMCATYPRVMNQVGEMLQQSLDLSCPEAARLVLLNPASIGFVERESVEGSIRPASYPGLPLDQVKEFRNLRRSAITLLQDRSYPVWKRLLHAGGAREPQEEKVNPAAQLALTLELIVARLTLDANPRRFLECYAQFMQGIEWTSKSSIEELGVRYADAYSKYYVPLMSSREYILENYLVNYVHRTLFPVGLPEGNRRIQNERVSSPAMAQFMLMAAGYGIVRTLLIGLAAFHKTEFSIEHVIKAVQSCSKTFEHSATYPGKVVEMLAAKDMTTPHALRGLVQDPA